jgi:hypothetical protein
MQRAWLRLLAVLGLVVAGTIGATTFAPAAPDTLADPVSPDTASVHVAAPGRGSFALAPGTLMRITPAADSPGIVRTRGPMFRATLLRATADSLWVAPRDEARVLALAKADVRLEVHAGRSHFNGAWSGAALGLFAGLGVGAIVAIVNASQSDDETGDFGYIAYPVLCGAVAMPAGAVIGGISGVERWERVE